MDDRQGNGQVPEARLEGELRGQARVRRALALNRAARLQELLGLTDDELCAALDADPLTVLADDLDHRPEVSILLALLAEAEERAGAAVLRRWVRVGGPAGRPLDHLVRRDFDAFEDALDELGARGFVLRGGGR